MKNIIKLPEEGIFSNRQLYSMWLPVLIEQIMIASISLADTGMSVYIGETAVGGISLITTLDNLVKQMMYALAIGGSVVVSQYIGSGQIKNANKTVKSLIYSVFMVALVLNAGLYILRAPIVSWLAGNSEELVKSSASTYLVVTAFSMPFYAIYYASTVTFRAMGNTRVPMLCSTGMMILNLLLKWFFIYKMNLGVFGAGFSTLLSVAFVGVIMLFILVKKKNMLKIEKIYKPEWNFSLIGKIFCVGAPNSVENGMFQLGLLLLQRLTASFGTYALSANAIAKAISPVSYLCSTCSGVILITVVGQSMGSGSPKQARMYIKHVMKLNYMLSATVNILMLIFTKELVGLYDISPDTATLAAGVLRLYIIGSLFAYPFSTVLPQALRGAGDTRFTMVVSVITMFAIRIGLAYILAKSFNMGLYGIWLAMVLEWAVKGFIYIIRYKKGKWEEIKVIE